MLYAQIPQLLHVAEQFAIDFVARISHEACGAGQAGGARQMDLWPSCSVTDTTPSGSLAKRPSGRHGSPGRGKSEPLEPPNPCPPATKAAWPASPGPTPPRRAS